jgi:hypothetical protein
MASAIHPLQIAACMLLLHFGSGTAGRSASVPSCHALVCRPRFASSMHAKHMDGKGLVLTQKRQLTRMLLRCCSVDGETRGPTAELQVGSVSRSSFRPMPSGWRSTVLVGQARVQPATVTMGGERHVAEMMMPHSCHPSIQRIDQHRNCCAELTTRSGPRADSPRRPHYCLLFHKCRMCVVCIAVSQ